MALEVKGQQATSRPRVVLFVLAVLSVVSFGAAKTWALYENTLLIHEEWGTTKPELERGVMGAITFYTTPQALARNRLNLDAWFGFEEILSRVPRDLVLLEFDFRLADGGYINALFDYRDEGFSGVRFSSRPDFPNAAFRAAVDGEFTSYEVVPAPVVAPGIWHRARIEFDDGTVLVTVDDARFGQWSRSPGIQRTGFRGGQRGGWVDDVRMAEADGQTHDENFTNTSGLLLRFFTILGCLLLLTFLGAAASRKLAPGSERDVAMATVMCSLSLGVLIACAYGYQYVRGSSYWLLDDDATRVEEEYWILSSREDIVAGISSRYAADVPPGVTRILALGGSQTWGAGAKADADTWPAQLERRLNEADESQRFEVVNAGVSGFVAGQILDLMRNDLAGLHATAAIVNVSSNDMSVSEFELNLDQLLQELNSRNIRPILMLEPNSVERLPTDSQHGDLTAKHAVMRALGARYGLSVIDMHAYLSARRDDGFLWWDFVHLTNFGQRLVAEELAVAIPQILGTDQP